MSRTVIDQDLFSNPSQLKRANVQKKKKMSFRFVCNKLLRVFCNKTLNFQNSSKASKFNLNNLQYQYLILLYFLSLSWPRDSLLLCLVPWYRRSKLCLVLSQNTRDTWLGLHLSARKRSFAWRWLVCSYMTGTCHVVSISNHMPFLRSRDTQQQCDSSGHGLIKKCYQLTT